MTIEISILDQQKKLKINKSSLEKIIRQILKKCSLKSVELSFVFVSSQKIRALNKKFMKRAYVTDVLAFDMRDQFNKKKKDELFGDIIISSDAVLQNSKNFDTTLQEEFILYVIHGILHLCGYDDHSCEDIAKMRKKEKELLQYFKKDIERVIAKR